MKLLLPLQRLKLDISSHRLHRLFRWYLLNQDGLVERYNGKFLIIKDDEVKGAYATEKEAYFDAVKKYGLGTFLMQKCTQGDEAYTQKCHKQRFS